MESFNCEKYADNITRTVEVKFDLSSQRMRSFKNDLLMFFNEKKNDEKIFGIVADILKNLDEMDDQNKFINYFYNKYFDAF